MQPASSKTVFLLEQTAWRRAEQIREAVEKHNFTLEDGTTVHATISVGFIHCQAYKPSDSGKILSKVDSALYEAKNAGRNKVIKYAA